MIFHDLDVKRGVADQGDVKRLLLATREAGSHLES
jgi:hypothetical protein